MLLVTIFWCGVSGPFAVDAVVSTARHLRAQRVFATTTGQVARAWSEHDRRSAVPRLVYRYEVNGRSYESDRLAFGFPRSMSREEAQQFVEAHPVGGAVTVHYDPQQPGESVIQRDVPTWRWFMLVAILPFVAIGALLVLYTVRLAVRR